MINETTRAIVMEALVAKDTRIAQLEAALKPFADEAKGWNALTDDGLWIDDFHSIKVVDLRRAAAALDPK